jgi:hypothetical protein
MSVVDVVHELFEKSAVSRDFHEVGDLHENLLVPFFFQFVQNWFILG